MADDRFTTVRIPRELHERIKQLIQDRKELGYHTVSRFVDEAVKTQLKMVDNAPKPLGDEDKEK